METKVGLIPRVMVQGAMGPKDYGLLVTDQRCIFVLEKASKAVLWGALGDALLTDKKSVDYDGRTIDELAADGKSMVINNLQVRGVGIKKSLGGYVLSFDYEDSNGKVRAFKSTLVPPAELLRQRKEQGVDKKAVSDDYARAARAVLEKGLPQTVARAGSWEP